MKRRSISFEVDVVQLIEDYRRTQTPIPSFNQAINDMLRERQNAMLVPLPEGWKQVGKATMEEVKSE